MATRENERPAKKTDRDPMKYPVMQKIANLIPNPNKPENSFNIRISHKINGGSFGSLHKVKVSSNDSDKIKFKLFYVFKPLRPCSLFFSGDCWR